MKRTIVVLSCALVASLALAGISSGSEPWDSAPLRPLSDGGFGFPEITGPTAPEEYPFLVNLEPGEELQQVSSTEIVGYAGGYRIQWITEEPAADGCGATVPTTLALTGEDIVTLTVHFRAGNPAAGGAPYVFPIRDGKGWEGGCFAGVSEKYIPGSLSQPTTPACTVPSLHGLTLRAAKSRLRVADCSLGQVRLARGTAAAKGKVVKQYLVAGTHLAAGAPVAIKLGPRRPA